ncbi:uncharacterized protein LOC126365981 [Schistocerca gregaria]|uniref:uncharacterized protein LOC126365981 n=1 Tax=Schistocerca gregaria TaxID=7010 RepID=UPI00211E38A1|nr:uncharacterized protein LOC126365981 [Schistocerca gregaria]XP_049864747.1 uncharacterized protein LOC126365981 [Schistocerca gregaria]
MVAPRWLLTASSCLRSDDSRTDAYSVPVEVTVTITGKKYRTEGAVFAPGGGVALARLQEPPESALVMTGRLDLADPIPATLWTRCVVLGMGRCPDGVLKGSTPVRCPEQMYAAGALAVSGSRGQPAGTQRTEPGVVRAPCSGEPGAPLACHRDFSASNWPPPPPALTAEPPENEPAQLVLVGVSAGKNRPGLSCRGSSADYRSIGPLQEWVERAIAYANRQLERINGRPVMVPLDPYAQRLQRLKMEGSLPELNNSRGTSTSERFLISLLTAVASRVLHSL